MRKSKKVEMVPFVYDDESERPVSVTSPDGGVTAISYDGSGYATNIASSALPPMSLGHDALGYVNAVSLPGPGGATRTLSSENNWRGNPLAVTNFDGTDELFAYEGNGRRVTRHVDALGREDVYKWTLGRPVHAGRVVG